MKFRTEFIPEKNRIQLDVSESVVLLGSCFTTSVGDRMRMGRWRAFSNPCGVLYNPMSIANTLELALSDNKLDVLERSIVERDGRWVSWFMDSGSSRRRKEECISALSDSFHRMRMLLQECQAIIITFGTSWVYELSEIPGYVVANCHKFPEKTFSRRLLSVSEIITRWKSVMELVQQACGKKKFIFTVSPIRHLRDGFEGNSLSKSILLLSCAELCANSDCAVYFPSFEIMNDDMRDYRFYASDMIHPSDTAVDYIWEKFKETFIDERGQKILSEGVKVSKSLLHRPIIADETECSIMLARQQEEKNNKLEAFLNKYPGMLGFD